MTAIANSAGTTVLPPAKRLPTPAEVEHLRAQVDVVRLARIRLEEADLDAEAAERVFYQQHDALFARQRSAKDAVTDAENVLKVTLTSLYRDTGAKKVVPGVEVAVGDAYEFDTAAADAWTKERQICRIPERFDADGFVKLLKSGAVAMPEFAKKVAVPKVRIAGDLDAALREIKKERVAQNAAVTVAAMLLVGALAGCGRTPTPPPPCTAATATKVDTIWETRPDSTRVIKAIVLDCLTPRPR